MIKRPRMSFDSPKRRSLTDRPDFRNFLLHASPQKVTHAAPASPEPLSEREKELIDIVKSLTEENRRLTAEAKSKMLFKQIPKSRSSDDLKSLLGRNPPTLEEYKKKTASSGLLEGYRVAGAIERAKTLKARREHIEKQLYLIDHPPIIIPEGRPSYMQLSNREDAEELVYYIEPDKEVTEKFGLSITGTTLQCLRHGQWLNDEVINFYLQLVQQRAVDQPNLFRSCFAWNTFFWQKLSEDGRGYSFKSVQRWSIRKKVDVFSFDLMIVPINVGRTHWALGFVDLKKERICYWDSLGGDHPQFKKFILQYVQDEWADKKEGSFPYNFTDEGGYDQEIPMQSNSYDCGVFTCLFAECLSRDRGVDFDQDDIADARLVIASQIGRGSILV